MNLPPSPWLQCWQPNPNAQLRLFCFPYSGAGASVFRPWAQADLPQVEVWGIQLPGRERRLREPLICDLRVLVQHLQVAINPWLDFPYAFYGHSLGALIAYELICQNLSLDIEQVYPKIHSPRCLFVGGRQAPHLPSRQPEIYLASNHDLIQELRQLGGTPETVLQDASLMQLFLPILRADLQMNETYVYRSYPPIPCPIVAFGGTNDPKVTPADVDAWHSHTHQAFNRQLVNGNHFFLKEQQDQLLALIQVYLKTDL
jgi:medium-chain acyl-[acyl-carrier-protein] hydrolase